MYIKLHMMWQVKEAYTHSYGLGLFNLLLIPMIIFDLVLRGFALWKSARNSQNVWFIFLLIVNSMGILPCIYLILNRDIKTESKKTSNRKK